MKKIIVLALCAVLLFGTFFAVTAQVKAEEKITYSEAAILDAMAENWIDTCMKVHERCGDGLIIYGLGKLQFLSDDMAREIYLPLKDGLVEDLNGKDDVYIELNFDEAINSVAETAGDEIKSQYFDALKEMTVDYLQTPDGDFGTEEYDIKREKELDLREMVKKEGIFEEITLADFIKENYSFTLGFVSSHDAVNEFNKALSATDLATKRKHMLIGASLATFACEMSIENCDEIVKSTYDTEQIEDDSNAQLELAVAIAENAVDVVGELVPQVSYAMDALEITTDIAIKTLSMRGKLEALGGYIRNPDTIEGDMSAYYQALSNQYDKYTYTIENLEIWMNEYVGYLYSGVKYEVVDVPEQMFGDQDNPGFPVVGFDGVFVDSLGITEITIPSTIRSRNDWYVIKNCDKLEKVYYNAPDCQDGYLGYFFSECDSDFVIEFGDGIQSIPEQFIYKCGITAIEFPVGVKSIGNGALVECPNLKTVTIPHTVEVFDIPFGRKAVVEDCGKLETVYYNAVRPEGSYYNAVFSGCGNDVEEMHLIIGDHVEVTPVFFLYDCGVKSVNFPEGVIQIREEAIRGCEKLETITIPSTVTSFSDNLACEYVFSQCNNLKTVNYNALNAEGDVGAFIFRDIHSDFTMNFGPNIESIPEKFMTNCDLSEIVFPEGVKTIHYKCLVDCDKLMKVTMPSTVETVEYDFLSDCGSVTDVYFNANCTNVSNSGLITDCGDFTNPIMTVHLGENVTTVPARFIERCSIREFVYPEGIQIIHHKSLINCSALETVVIPSTVKQLDYPVVSNCDNLQKVEYNAVDAVNVDESSYLIYSSGDADGMEVCFAENIQSLPNRLIYDCSVREFTFPGSITHIPERAFYKCEDLTVVTIPQNIVTIGDEAFSDATGLREIYFNAVAMNDLDNGNGVFADAGKNGAGITVVVGKEVTRIPAALFCPYSSFNDDPKITSFQFTTDGACTSIGESAFAYCESLTAIKLPASIDSVQANAFYNCVGLTDVNLGSVTTIGNAAFGNCESLRNIVIPSSVTILGEGAFNDCTALCDVTIGGGLTTIPRKTFKGCTGLTWIAIPDNITDIGYSAFYGCTNLTEIALQDGIQNIDSNAFAECDSLASIIYCGTLLQWRQVNITNYGNKDFQQARLQYHNWIDHPETDDQICSICGMVACEPTAHTYVKEVTAPTCLDDGYTTYICSTCGHIYVGDHVDATGHTFEDGICSVCGAWDPIKWVGTQLQATSNLDMQFALRISDLKGTTGNYIILTRTYADGSTEEVKISQKNWISDGTFYIVAYSGLSAKEMGDTISAVVYNRKNAVISQVRSESIESYALSMLGKITNSEQKTMFVDLLNYGAEAQKFFGYNEEHLVNANLTDEQKSWGTQKDITVTDQRVKGDHFYGSNLSLENVILLQMAFDVKPTKDMYAVINFTDHTGKAVEEKLAVTDNNGYAMISVNSLAIADYRALVTCTLYDADGTVVGYAIDSMESYVARSQTDLGKAIMRFGASAYAYFH